jgi:hypothetical protein
MAGTSINCLAIVLKELGWSYTRIIAELRRQAAIDGVVLPKTESLIRLISRWVNNHQQPDDFYRDLLSRATGRHRFELFSDEAAVALLAARTNAGIAPIVTVGSHEDMNRRQLLARSAPSQPPPRPARQRSVPAEAPAGGQGLPQLHRSRGGRRPARAGSGSRWPTRPTASAARSRGRSRPAGPRWPAPAPPPPADRHGCRPAVGQARRRRGGRGWPGGRPG